MNKIVAIFLIIILLLQSNIRLIVVGYYELNKNFIASTLCENRMKPSLKCDGKCFLQKKIKAQEKQEKRLASFLKTFDEVTLLPSFDLWYSFSKQFLNILKEGSHYLIKAYPSPLKLIFQPPQ